MDSSTKHIGEPLKNLHTKKNVLIVCIAHGMESELPGGDSFYREGDTVVIVTSGDVVIYQLNDIFEA